MKPLLGGTLCIYNLSNRKQKKQHTFFPSTDTNQPPLQELSNGVEEGGNTGDGHAGTVGNSGTGAGGRGSAAGAGGSAGLAVGGGGVGGVGIAVVGTLDDSLADALEVGAVEGTVSALEVEATLNIGQTSKVNTR
jgi:hypothetical protein